MSRRTTIVRNTLYNAGGRMWDAIVGFFLIAYVLNRIGVEAYGLWGVVGAFAGYAALFDPGMGSAYAKYIAEYAARGEPRRVNAVVNTAFFFYVVFGLAFVGITWFVVGSLGQFALNHPEFVEKLGGATTVSDFVFLLRGALILYAVSNCVTPFTAVQTGLQRMGITNLLSVGASVAKLAVTIALIESGFGLSGWLYGNACGLAVFGVLSVAASKRLCPSLRIARGHCSRAEFRRLFAFGWRTQVSRLSNLVMFETDILFITLFLGDLRLAGMYMVGIYVANRLRQIPPLLMSALVPAVSDLDARGRSDQLRRLYLTATKYTAAVTVPASLFLAGTAGFILHSWQGSGIELVVAIIILRVMATGYIANMLPAAGVTIALGMGRPDVQMKAGLISMASNIGLTVGLFLAIGFWGIPIATAVSMVVSSAWFFHAMRNLTGVSARTLFEASVAVPLLASLPGVLVCFGFDVFLEPDGRLTNVWLTLSMGGIFGCLYAFCMHFLPLFNAEDWDLIDRTIGLRRLPGFLFVTRRMRQSGGSHA